MPAGRLCLGPGDDPGHVGKSENTSGCPPKELNEVIGQREVWASAEASAPTT